MRLHIILGLSNLDIIDGQSAGVVDGGNITNRNRRGFEGTALDSFLLFPFGKQDKLSLIDRVNVEYAFGARSLPEENETGTSWDPLSVKGGETKGLIRVDE